MLTPVSTVVRPAGLADHYAEGEGACEAAALALAREVAAAGPLALRMAKAAISLGADADLYTGLRIEEGCYAQVLPSRDRVEGLRAFAEKRAPAFTGE
jgi:methylglutaconyl-CoA hydratase